VSKFIYNVQSRFWLLSGCDWAVKTLSNWRKLYRRWRQLNDVNEADVGRESWFYSKWRCRTRRRAGSARCWCCFWRHPLTTKIGRSQADVIHIATNDWIGSGVQVSALVTLSNFSFPWWWWWWWWWWWYVVVLVVLVPMSTRTTTEAVVRACDYTLLYCPLSDINTTDARRERRSGESIDQPSINSVETDNLKGRNQATLRPSATQRNTHWTFT